jgi:hypothetical protein
MISSLTSALNIHLNIGQKSTLNTSAAFMSLETLSIQLLSNKQIQQVGNAQIHLPTLNINQNRTVLLQVRSFSRNYSLIVSVNLVNNETTCSIWKFEISTKY